MASHYKITKLRNYKKIAEDANNGNRLMRIERLIVCIDIFLLTFAIGINAYRVSVWCTSTPPCEECGE